MEPIAIVGIGCRFPGAPDPEAFWSLLLEGRDAIRDVPTDRWDVDALHDPDPDAPGTMTARQAGFLDDIDRFDASFFGISPREATSMDPQQRLLLEVTWEALERAGVPPPRLAGTKTGVFIGISSFDYGLRQAGDLTLTDAYSGTGQAHSIAANRLSYLLDLRGPSLAVDTACSSALVAVHLACQSLWRGESTLALAGGVNVIASPEASIGFSKARMLAPDGRCKTFDAAADGYVRGEGCGVVALKPLAAAQRDCNPILALIRGTAVNQDGRSNGLTAPNGPAQQGVIREALQVGGVAPAEVGYIECHGTGTPLGDPIELQALMAVLGAGRDATRPLVVGSVKPNVGHLESAAGVAGLIKAVLCLQHGTIPPQVHFGTLNPLVRPGAVPLAIPTQPRPWPPTRDAARIAGVSAFGFGGTNAHVTIAESPDPGNLSEPPDADPPSVELLTLSARSEPALRTLAGRLAEHLDAHPETALPDLAAVLGRGRAHFEHRAALVADSASHASADLHRLATGDRGLGLQVGRIASRRGPRVAFLFTGQGSQYPGMGRELYETIPVFRQTLDRCAELLGPWLDRPLLDVLFADDGPSSPIHETAYTQAALFALEYALATVWRSWGVEPAVAIGHSVGELVAACMAGVFSLDDGLRLVAARGRLMQALTARGSMVAVLAPEARTAAEVARCPTDLAIAAVNGPDRVVLAGQTAAVQEVIARLQREGVACRPLNVSHAFHSPLLEPMLDAFEGEASEIAFSAPQIPLISNLTGNLWPPGAVPDARYWRRHVRETVRFADGVRALAQQRCSAALEIGPQPTTIGLMRHCNPPGPNDGFPSLQPGRADRTVMLESLGALYTLGQDVQWDAVYGDRPRRHIALPTYPFERERFWVERGQPRPPVRAATWPGARLATAHPTFETTVSPTSPAYLADHRLRGLVVLPATGYLALAAAALRDVAGDSPYTISAATFRRALILDGEARRVQTVLVPHDDGGWGWSVYSRPDAEASGTVAWTLHAEGAIRPGGAASPEPLPPRAGDGEPADEHYRVFEARGYQYGPAFRAIARLWRQDGEAVGRLAIPPEIGAGTAQQALHPALLDAGAQVLAAAMRQSDRLGGGRDTFVPAALDELRVHGSLNDMAWCHARLTMSGTLDGDAVVGDCTFYDGDGRALVEMRGLRSLRLRSTTPAGFRDPTDDWLYEIVWRRADRVDPNRQAEETPNPQPLRRAAQLSAAPTAPCAGEGEQVASSSFSPPPPHTGEGLGVGASSHAGEELGVGASSRTRTGAGDTSWLILTDRVGVGDALAARLTARGDRAVLVAPRRDDIERAVAQAQGSNGSPFRGVVHLGSLDVPPDADLDADALDAGVQATCGSVLTVLQTLLSSHGPPMPRLWLVTRGAVAVEGHSREVAAFQAPVWGLARTIVHEQPGLRCSLVDLDPAEPFEGVDGLLAEIVADDREEQIAYRDGARYVARLARLRLDTPPTPLPVRSDATYLVTGGLGALGLAVAAWLVERGARTLFLIGRRPPSVEAQQTLDALAREAQVVVMAADVAREEDVSAAIARIDSTLPPLRGIVHAAGVLDGGPVATLDAARLRSVMAPKLHGTRNLDRLTAELPLDFFVLFSSVTSVLGSPGQANYAAANAYLDAVAHERQRVGRAALSINWGGWAEAGMAARIAEGGWEIPDGIEAIRPDDGLHVLGRLMQTSQAQVTAIPIDWPKLVQFAGPAADRPLIDDLEIPTPSHTSADAVAVDRATLQALDPAARQERIETYVRLVVARLLQRDPARIETDRPLNTMGLDSLTGSVLVNRIETDLAVTVPLSALADGPTIADLAALALAAHQDHTAAATS